MQKLPLTLACWDYDRTRPILDGSIAPEGIEITPIVSRPSETFFRMLRFQEFDVSELSLSNYTMLVAQGNCPFVAIPIFPSRVFRHSCIYINTNSGIKEPKDLAGKKIGAPEFAMTAAVFARGLLLEEYGVTTDSIEWFSGTQDGLQRPSRIDFDLRPSIRLTRLPIEQDMGPMLESGELQALMTPNMPTAFANGSPNVARLFPNYRQMEAEYYQRTGIFPIMHTVVIRREIYEKHPWVARSLYDAFVKAKQYAYRELYETDALKISLPWVVAELEETRRAMGHDYWAYGIKPNLPVLKALPQYLVEQGLASRAPSVEELFVPNTMD